MVSGNIFMPCTKIWNNYISTFWAPMLYPRGSFPRIYPQALYWLGPIIIPVARYYKLRWWQWVLILGALAICRTFTFITGVIVTYVLFQPSAKKAFWMIFIGIAAFVSLYFIDGELPRPHKEKTETFFRIKSSVDQLFDLAEAQDDVDVADAGSGRLAQAMPKLELLYKLDKEWTGFGFLNADGTTVKKYVIENTYYHNQSESIEVATDIEITVLQVLITIGYIGLAIHILFFVYLYIIIRKLKYSVFFLSLLAFFAWLGIGGFEGWITIRSMCILGLGFSAVILANRDVLNGFATIRKPRGTRAAYPPQTKTASINPETPDNGKSC